MLKSASIPLLAAERELDCPLVFGGGPSLTANPEPFADFFDVILLGDAEITIPIWLRAGVLPAICLRAKRACCISVNFPDSTFKPFSLRFRR